MANDPGAVVSERHAALLAIMMAGVRRGGLAGRPAAGCAIFWTTRAVPLLWTSARCCRRPGAAGLAHGAAFAAAAMR